MSKETFYNHEASTSFSRNCTSFKWTIKNFSLCTLESGQKFRSPIFASATWTLEMFPVSVTPVGSMSAYLCQISKEYEEEKRVNYKISLQDKDGVHHLMLEGQKAFTRNKAGGPLIDRKMLMEEKRDQLLPGDTLTVFCELNDDGIRTHSPVTTVTDREAPKEDSDLEELAADFGRILTDHKSCDVILLSSDGQQFPAHKAILEARSSVFSAMFRHDMEETRRGEVCIEDINGPTLKQLLHYIYTAKFEDISSCDVLSLFVAADKYDVGNMKKKCVRYLLDTMSPETVCDAIVLGYIFKEEELKESATTFLSKEASKVIASNIWKEFVKKHAVLAAQVLESVLWGKKT